MFINTDPVGVVYYSDVQTVIKINLSDLHCQETTPHLKGKEYNYVANVLLFTL